MAGITLSSILLRDRVIVVGCLLAIILLSWAYILSGAGMDMRSMGDMEAGTMEMDQAPTDMGGMEMGGAPPAPAQMPMPATPWSFDYFLLVFVMWAVMMAAMMLPSAAPMLLFHASIAGNRTQPVATRTGAFGLGYVVVWTLFSLAAATLQWQLSTFALLSPMMATTSVLAAGLVLVAAGLYQWTPLKHACLRQCQSPLDFVLSHWRNGNRGAFVMGLHHGLFCLGCCWMLMLLLFVGGVMNLLWIAAIALFVLVEKVAPPNPWVSRAAGSVLVVWGAAVLLAIPR